MSRTKEEAAAYMRAWRARNKDRVRLANAAHYEKNRAAHLERKRAYYQAVRKAADATEEGRVKDRNRKARRRAQARGHVSVAEWNEIVLRHDRRCTYCRRSDLPLEMDHVVPLSRGGPHEAANIVPACKPCNSSKGARCG